MYNIYFLNEKVLEVKKEDLEQLIKFKYVKKLEDKYVINKFNKELHYLFNDKTSKTKRKWYLKEINKQKMICSICGKKYSLHVSPKIDNNGEVNFKEVSCVCKECRTNKLKNRDILVPKFKEKINWRKEKRRIIEEAGRLNLQGMEKVNYLKEECKKLNIEHFLKLILPPLMNEEEYYKEHVLNELNQLRQCNLDLSTYKDRTKVRQFLFKEMNGNCPVCNNRLKLRDISIDHILPKYLGGKDEIDNLFGMCEQCNKKKDNKDLFEFLIEEELRSFNFRFLKQAHARQKEYRRMYEQ